MFLSVTILIAQRKFVTPYISIFPNVTADSEGNFMPFFCEFFLLFSAL